MPKNRRASDSQKGMTLADLLAVRGLISTTNKFKMRKEYELVNGKKYAILWRKKGSDLTDKCPFCEKKHAHGEGEGHRVAHCMDRYRRGKFYPPHGFTAKDGTYFPPKSGYIIREY